MEGCRWGMWIEGCQWRDIDGRMSMEGCQWRDIDGGMWIEECRWCDVDGRIRVVKKISDRAAGVKLLSDHSDFRDDD